MLKNIIIYRFAPDKRDKWIIDDEKIKDSNFVSCLENDTGYNKNRIEDLITNTEDESISLDSQRNVNSRFTVSCMFKSRSMVASGEAPFISVIYEMVLRNNTSFVLCFDCGKKLSKVGVTLLANATTNDPGAIEHIFIDKQKFYAIKDWVLNSSLPGQVKKVTLRNVEHNYKNYKQIVLSSENLQDSDLFNNMFSSALEISNMSFETPVLRTTGRPITCRVNYWGGLTIYSGGLLDVEVFELMRAIENIFD